MGRAPSAGEGRETRERDTVDGVRYRLQQRLLSTAVWACLGIACMGCTALAQHVTVLGDDRQPAPPHRIHLMLKDGSYQIVTSYRVVGKVVHYISAERGGEEEEIPLGLIDLEATKAWEKAHTQVAPDAGGSPPPIDPELLKEEEARRSLTPMVAPDLYLPERDSVLAIDYWQGTPELVPLMQSDGALNRTTGHSVLKKAVNPASAPHTVVQLKGERSYVQMHVAAPVFYVRVGDDSDVPASGTALTVDTHGASGKQPENGESSGGAATSRYVILRVDVRQDARLVSSFSLWMLGQQRQQDLIETHSELLPGGHWMKLTPAETLLFGEYALMEVLSDKEVNGGVWDFGVHPPAPENRDVIRPEPRRPAELERRKPQ